MQVQPRPCWQTDNCSSQRGTTGPRADKNRSAFDFIIARQRTSNQSSDIAADSGVVQRPFEVKISKAHIDRNQNTCDASGSNSNTLQAISNHSYFNHCDDHEPALTLEEIELEQNVWGFTDPVAITDSILFDNNGGSDVDYG